MLASLPCSRWSLAVPAEEGDGEKARKMSASERSIDISHALSKVIRRKGVNGMQRGGFTPLRRLLDHPYMVARKVTLGDVYHIVRGGGGGGLNALRIGSVGRRGVVVGGPEAISASQGHSLGIGADPDVLPSSNDVSYVAHGTSSNAARRIAEHGLNRGDRVHMHF